MPLWYILKKVSHYPQNEMRIIRLRSLEDDNARRDLKRTFPCWLPGEWTDTTKAGLQKFSGFLQFDIDHIADPESAKLILQTIPSVALVAVSCGGQGLYGLLSVPEDAQDEDKYIGYWMAFRDYLWARGMELDPKGKNINRLRFLSLDDHFFIPRACGVWTERVEAPPASFTVSSPSPSYTSTATRSIDPNRKQYTYAQKLSFCQSLTNRALTLGIDPAPTSTLWFNMGVSLAAEFEEQGRDMFLTISSIWESQHGPQKDDPSEKYDECMAYVRTHGWEGGCYYYESRMDKAGVRLKK